MINLLLRKWHFHKEEKNQPTLCKKKSYIIRHLKNSGNQSVHYYNIPLRDHQNINQKEDIENEMGQRCLRGLGHWSDVEVRRKGEWWISCFLHTKVGNIGYIPKMFMLACCFKPNKQTFNLMWWFWISSLASEKYILCYKLAS